MKRILEVCVILIVILIFFKPVFLNKLLPIPSDTIIGLYYPFRDFYGRNYPNGIPFKNFLITDPVRQLYPWRNLSIQLEKKIELPLWNPYNFSGYPLLANYQSSPFYPLNILYFLLSFQSAWSFQIILQPLLGGIFLYFYLQKMRLSKIASLLGGIVFGFCGFSTAWMEWNTVMQAAIWLPLILLAIENLLDKLSVKWSIFFVFAQCSAFFAGHLQTFFYLSCVHETYIIARILQITSQEKRSANFFVFAFKKYIPFIILGGVIILLTAIQWLPLLQFISLSARNIDQNWHIAGWFLPWGNLLQFVFPDFFGNPTTNNYWGIWNYAEFIGYVGIFPLMISLFAIFFRRDKKTLFFAVLFFLSLIFALPTLFAQLPFVLNIPFISTSQPTRLLFVTDFSLAILCALGLDYFIKPENSKQSKKIFFPIVFLFFVFTGVWIVTFVNSKFHIISPENISITKHNIILPTIFFIVSVFACIAFVGLFYFPKAISAKTRKKSIQVFAIFVLVLTLFDLFRFAWKFEAFAPGLYLYPSTKTLLFLQQKAGISRIMTVDSRILPPNFTTFYHLQSVDGYDPLYIQKYGELIAASERGGPNIQPPFGFNRIITPHNFDSRIINLLGVKYILSLSDINSKSLTKVFQEGQTRVYENRFAIPRAFFAENIVYANNNQGMINILFDPNFKADKTAILSINQRINVYPSTGTVAVKSYSENSVSMETDNKGDGFLVFTDINYPTWHVTVDGTEKPIIQSDYIFRGVLLPKGKHALVFWCSLI